ncbi:MAG: hypothetical protein OHK0039_23670 [Bacteroidia bacterium]
MKGLLLLPLLWVSALWAQPLSPDDTGGALRRLDSLRAPLLQRTGPPTLAEVGRMIDLGLWAEAAPLLAAAGGTDPAWMLLRARFAWLNNDFRRADSLARRALRYVSDSTEALLMIAQLDIEAWRLDAAAARCRQVLRHYPGEPAATLLLGRVWLLQKAYDQAAQAADAVLARDSLHAGAHLLRADVYFWEQQPERSVPHLLRCLEQDPFHADARFNYGYAIWRRVDATQLPAMAAQWEVALAVHPLHFLTHWHWGNGHTHLTFADYADPQESQIRGELARADSLIAQDSLARALAWIRQVHLRYPASVLPEMMLGSAWYMAYGLPGRLDSAQAAFRRALARKPHYGPAHNGLAAVIKQQRFAFLDMYDSLEQTIAQTRIADPEAFAAVFPDVAYYPGDRVGKMVWNQLYTGVAYFPFLARLGRTFVIPPLHVDLALAMDEPYFRMGTTFDNRQWMDIRGVGSGATGIEYVERGAHLERNVTLHEYVHLFHGEVFTEAEMRAVRQRYYYAMEHGCIIDYYSANNEFEYLAQTFPAYFIPRKVHPLNHKSLNTRGDLLAKDPLMYAFIDSLVQRHRAWLAGDSSAMASNWAQVYVNLAGRARVPEVRVALLDTALRWDSLYLPAYLAMARLYQDAQDWEPAARWLDRALAVQPGYAPALVAQSGLWQARAYAGLVPIQQAVRRQAQLYRQAIDTETDPDAQAAYSEAFRLFYRQEARWVDAIEVAEDYARQARTPSTYLRDSRDEALAMAYELRGRLGYIDEAAVFFDEIIRRKPQQYAYQQQYAQVLMANGRYRAADTLLAAGQRIRGAAGYADQATDALRMLCQVRAGDSLRARPQWDALGEPNLQQAPYVWIALACAWGDTARAMRWLASLARPRQAEALGSYLSAQGLVAASRGDTAQAVNACLEALQVHPYQMETRFFLIDLLRRQGRTREAYRVAQDGLLLPMPPGPVMRERLKERQD